MDLPGELIRAPVPADVEQRVEIIRDVRNRLVMLSTMSRFLVHGGCLTVARMDMSSIIRKKTRVIEARISASLKPVA